MDGMLLTAIIGCIVAVLTLLGIVVGFVIKVSIDKGRTDANFANLQRDTEKDLKYLRGEIERVDSRNRDEHLALTRDVRAIESASTETAAQFTQICRRFDNLESMIQMLVNNGQKGDN